MAHPDHLVAEAKQEVRHHEHPHDVAGEWIFMGISVALALFGWMLARWLYKDKKPDVLAERGGMVFNVLNNKYYVDELYNALFIKPTVKTSRSVLWKFFDDGVIDGLAVNGSANTVGIVGRIARLFQNGYVQSYLLFFLVGVLVILSIIL